MQVTANRCAIPIGKNSFPKTTKSAAPAPNPQQTISALDERNDFINLGVRYIVKTIDINAPMINLAWRSVVPDPNLKIPASVNDTPDKHIIILIIICAL